MEIVFTVFFFVFTEVFLQEISTLSVSIHTFKLKMHKLTSSCVCSAVFFFFDSYHREQLRDLNHLIWDVSL